MSDKTDRWLGHTWAEDFEEGRRWHLDGGNYHSVYWMYMVFGFLNQTSVRDELFRNHRTIHDYGCAEGDGTLLLRCLFPKAKVTGFDIWPGAVKLAKERWPNSGLSFEVGNVSDPKHDCDLLISIQTVDHVDDVAGTVKSCLAKSRVFVMAWADLPIRPDHPSQDRTWYDNVPKPTTEGVVPMPRYSYEEGLAFIDTIQVFAWINE